MNEIKEFSTSVIENLGYYVYSLSDPETDTIFYIGKGMGNRIFAHINHAISTPMESDKLEKIRSIHSKGLQVKHIIHRHGLTEKEAYEVESALIDFIGISDLTNIVQGHHSNDRGKMTISEVISQYDAPKIEIVEPAILIIVNQLFRRGMSEAELYEITRGNWPIGVRRNKAKFAFCVNNGLIRQVYTIQKWFPVEARSESQKKKERWRFEGEISQELQHYIGCNIGNYLTKGAQFPVKYINC